MLFKELTVISENIIKPNFLHDLKENYDLNWALSPLSRSIRIRLRLSNFIDIKNIIQLFKWIKYKNTKDDVKFKFDVVNWDDEREFDFEESRYIIDLNFDGNQNIETYKFCSELIKIQNEKNIVIFLKDVINKEYFE